VCSGGQRVLLQHHLGMRLLWLACSSVTLRWPAPRAPGSSAAARLTCCRADHLCLVTLPLLLLSLAGAVLGLSGRAEDSPELAGRWSACIVVPAC
jgi:hypothetical protein